MNKYQTKLKFLIERSNHLYQKYKDNSFYINALLIKDVNKEIIKLLLSKGYKFKKDQEVEEILDHFEIWYHQFIEHEKKIDLLNEIFIFERIEQATPYPKQAIDKILKEN